TWTSKQTTVTTTDEVAGTTSTTTYSYAARNLPVQPYAQSIQSTQMPVESSVVTADGGGKVLRTVAENWNTVFPYLVTDQCTTLDNNQQDWAHITYNPSGQLTEKDEHDYAAAGACGQASPPLLRKTVVAYASFPGRNIVDRPSSEVTYSSDGATRLAETDLGYDANANLLSDKHWVAGSNFLETDYSVDAYGNRLTAKDAAGSTTSFDYSNGFNAYPSTITDALGHTDQYAWNNASGTMASHTDQNSNVTSYAYSDGWDRLTQINFPDGGETTFAYTPATIETKRLQSANVWMDHFDNFDGLGRAALSATETSAGVWSRVDTCYNGTGEESFVSYPYTSAAGIGAAVCNEPGDSFQFDALGRPTVTTHSDGTTFLTT